jgi:hypothetical protein
MFFSKNGRTNIRWHPRSCDYKGPDTTRLAGKSNFFRLKLSEYALLENTGRLTLILRPAEQVHIYRIAPEKRKPLLRPPLWGLPPRWR